MPVVKTKISAKVIAHSKSKQSGGMITTFELIYPRFIHGELMTHRMFSRNAASSRAIPVKKVLAMVQNDPALPIHWGKNQPGMQAKEELTGEALQELKDLWGDAADVAVSLADYMDGELKAHKQIVNRITEPFQWMKTIVTATEFDNFFWLRNHEDAQPEIKALAEAMLEAISTVEPFDLSPGDWHVPYFGAGYWLQGCGIRLEEALAISASCCAQVSYRVLDASLEKAEDIFKRLVESEPVHASPFEHQASPMGSVRFSPALGIKDWEEGVTHVDRDAYFWSGNFKGWIQHRQLIPNNVYNNKGGI